MNKDTESDHIKRRYRIEYLILLAGLVLLIVMNFATVRSALSKISSAVYPLFLGAIIAFVLDIPTDFFEKKLFKKIQHPVVKKYQHQLSFALALMITFGIVATILNLIVPQVIQSMTVFIGKLPEAYELILKGLERAMKESPDLQTRIAQTMPSDENMLKEITAAFTNWAGGAMNFLGNTLSNIVSLVFAFIFALYIVLGKKDLKSQIDRLLNWLINPYRKNKLYSILRVVNDTFANFFVGQVIEAVILGALCTVGLYIFRFPYAPMIGSFVGLTALIPMVGAYLGGVFGLIMIGSENPVQGGLFVIFLVVLQQLEGNLIYPKVVGDKIGLPGIWVMAAVVVGGSLFGIGGTLLGVPIAATIYKFLVKKTQEEEKKAYILLEETTATENIQPYNH